MKTKRNMLVNLLVFMQQVDPNGEYYLLIEILDMVGRETLLDLYVILDMWLDDLEPEDYMYKTINRYKKDLRKLLQGD